MKALYAFVFVCMSFHAFAVPAETPDNYLTYFKDVDDLDFVDETAAHDATPLPAVAMAPATEADTLIANEDCAENFNAVETVPGVAAIQPRDEDAIPQSTTRGPDTAMAPATEAGTPIADEAGAENSNAADTVPGVTATQPSDEDVTRSFAEVRDGL